MKNFLLVLFALSLVSATAIGHHAHKTTAPISPPPAAAAAPAPTPAPKQPPSIIKSEEATGKEQPAQRESAEERQEPVEVGEEGTVRVNTALVTVPLSVMDRDGRYISDLQREEFRIYEDGEEQEVTFFASLEKPFTVALVLDISDSAIFRMADVKEAAIAFVEQLRAGDRALVIAFDRRAQVLAEATGDREVLRRAIQNITVGAGTSLYNAVDMTLNQIMNRIEGRKAIILFTDGVDTSSMGATYKSNLRDAAESDSLIYTIQYELSPSGKRYPDGSGVSAIGVVGRTQLIIANKYLYRIAEKTGGRQFVAGDIEMLRQAFAGIAEELRHQYSLGYYPKKRARKGQQRFVRVRVTRPNLAVRARKSYLFPQTEKMLEAEEEELP